MFVLGQHYTCSKLVKGYIVVESMIEAQLISLIAVFGKVVSM